MKTSLYFSKRSACLLPILALCYYAYYYRCGLYPAGEGGVEGVTALRLISGKLPIVDVALNYNLLWFYPIVWLFKITGPSYTAIRIFFFTLCTLTSLLAYGIIWKTRHQVGLALLAGIIVLLIPGQLFRNYMAFIVMLNMAVFIKAYLLPCQNYLIRLGWLMASGLTLGLAFLIRLDIGFFLSIILLGLIVIFPITHGIKNHRNWLTSCAALFLAVTGLMAIHLPVARDAQKRGFITPFLAQYEAWPHMIVAQGSKVLNQAIHHFPQKESTTLTPPASAAPLSKPPAATLISTTSQTSNTKSTLARRSFTSHDIREQLMALNLYLPIACSLLLILIATTFLFSGLKNNDPHRCQSALIMLTSLGCSLTLFPQYFFWRPDMVHLSEFMVPMSVTLIMAIAFACEAFKTAHWFFKILLVPFLVIAISTLVLYFITGIQSQSTGGIAISEKRTVEFHGKNGVDVKLTPNEFEETSAIYQSIMAHSAPNEYVICFPYNPEINFMTDRPSYRRDLYIDDVTAPKTFDRDTISEIEKQQPAAIVINNWPINGTEHSRFKNWASETYSYIQAHYVLDYEKGILQVFVRPDKY